MPLSISVEQSIMDAVKDLLDSITFERDASDTRYIESSRIRIGMAPTTNEEIGECPCIVITPTRGKKIEQMDMEGGASNRPFAVEIAIIEAIEGDWATEQNKFLRWKEQVVNKLERDGSQWRDWSTLVESIWDFALDDSDIDRGKLASNYAFQSVTVTFQVHE